MKTARAAAIALAIALAACATPAIYAPATRPGGAGFSEVRIEENRYRVIYRDAANEAQASDYALLRSAELALSQGYDWFVVDARSTDREGYGSQPRVSVGVGGTNWGEHTSVGVGIGTGINLGGGPKSTVSLEIRLGRGPKPPVANAYDARAVQRTIRSRV